jgi:hypothetical protein
MTPEDADRYREALAEFREALRLPTVGVSREAQLEQLRALIRQFPEQARAFLDDYEAEDEAR